MTSSRISPFNGKTIVLELGHEKSFKAKKDLINYLREQHAQISYILTASTDYVLTTNNVDSYKIRRAKKLGIPVIDVEYVYQCRCLSSDQISIDINKFSIKSVEDQDNFTKTGTITLTESRANATKIIKLDLNKIKLWNADDRNLPHFDELTHCTIGKWAIFKETNDSSTVFFALELQIIPEQYYNSKTSDYRIRFRYEKQIVDERVQQHDKNVLIQYAFGNDPNEQQQLFASYYNRISTMPRITRIRDILPNKLGSKLLLRSLFTHRLDAQILDENIIEAEAALLELKSTNDPTAVTRFYSFLPHRSQYQIDLINNRRVLIEKLDLCQMLRDMLTVNELTNWNMKAPIEAKYRALKCYIETLSSSTPEYKNIVKLIESSTDSVAKQTDTFNFSTTLSHQQQLFHGSKYTNFLGILSRGLVMPKMVVEELGVTRTDVGCLGYGIYFSDSVSTSLQYTTASTVRPGRRLLCICRVALGESAKYYSFSPTLTKPADGFHSTHGIKRTEENHSMFIDNEYAIYRLDQQLLLYIVEVSWLPKDVLNNEFERLSITHHDQYTLKLSEHGHIVEVLMTIDDEIIEVAEQDYGLICPSSGKLVPLKSFHIRAQIVDTTVEVVMYQVYHNTSSVPIEAKYVFPLDENSTVCGFEAHINNKVIKGVVKEKEQAKQEYREAIEKGHGAYLMHQEEAQVFSVAVGNLPANNEVIIKITYVAELEIENDDIIFRLPAKMTSWQSKQAIETRDQSILRSFGIINEKVEFTFKTSIRMPYNITKLFSPTHRLRRKLTNCIAMIELVDNVLLDRDFILSITLHNPNLPRMSIETLSSDYFTSQACMLTFYPRFETLMNTNEQIEIIFIIDVSNSMDGNHSQQAKQLTHLFLTNMKIDDENTYFNLITFGSDNDECFPISVPTTKENLDRAKHFVLHSLIHRGNTDLFSVLHRYSLLPSKVARQFILVSDGHINDLNSILILLKQQLTMRYDRLFTCSIGNVANKHCLKQLANGASGGGLATIFDSNYRSKWKTKVLNILDYVRQPCVTSISIDWHGHVDEQEKFHMQAPKMIRSLFNGMRLTVYRFIRNCHKATLSVLIDGQEFVTNVFSSSMTATTGRILHCLTARTIIDDYENGLFDLDESENELMKIQYKRDLIDLSIKHSVVSAYTSFVAIEERDMKTDLKTSVPGVRLLDVMLEHDVDLFPYMRWDGDVSNLSLIKQKLIDARIALESASIARKKDVIHDIEKICQDISYRASEDVKFDIMMSIIRTYRYSLNEYNKADEFEQKMRDDIITEMAGATAEERQALEQQCQANNLLDDVPDYTNDFLQPSTAAATASSSTICNKQLPTTDNMMYLDKIEEELTKEDCPWQHVLEELETADDWNNVDLGFLDCMDETSYIDFTSRLSELRSKRTDSACKNDCVGGENGESSRLTLTDTLELSSQLLQNQPASVSPMSSIEEELSGGVPQYETTFNRMDNLNTNCLYSNSPARLLSPERAYRTISLAEEAASNTQQMSSGCMGPSIALEPKLKINKKNCKKKNDAACITPICDLLLLDVCPLGLGIEDIHGHMHTLIRRNTTIPVRTELWSIFTNAYAYQTTATIRIFEGEHTLTKYNMFLGEFNLSGLTNNFAAQTLEIAVRMNIDANGILHVDAEEARSGAKVSYTVDSNHQRSTKDWIEQHIAYVESQANAVAKSVYARKSDDPLYQHLHLEKTTDISFLRQLKDIQSTPIMMNELLKLQSENGSFLLNKELADVFHLDQTIFHNLEYYLNEHGLKSLALNLQNEILRLIGTGVILLWLVLQMQILHHDTFEFPFNIEQIKDYICKNSSTNMNEQIYKAIDFYQHTSQRHGIYCKQLELNDSSWDMFIQHLLLSNDPINS
ncbi:hypothetical protein I4U23_015385 [Adineta vaga]|nr:hypothetical protein I4U23_015385 [Adineta vaga]